MQIEASLYAKFVLYQEWESNDFSGVGRDKFHRFFYALTERDDPDQYPLNPAYAKMREEHRGPVPLYRASFRHQSIKSIVGQYRTVFKNNIVVHAYRRLKKFLRYT